jgi:acetyltransferase
MSVRNLEHLFRPRSVAVIGASEKPHSVGYTVMRNLLSGGFGGPIMPVNPRYESVAGVLAYPNVSSLPKTPDLAVVATPPPTVPKLIGELGERGTRAAVVLTAGLSKIEDASGRTLEQAMREAARPHLLRILGPNCLGLSVPGLKLNASFAHTDALPGRLAFVSQSGALCTGVLDWARSMGIGFSQFVSLGDSADVDFGDVLDYLASDASTQAILLYIESIREARKFMSAARAAARNKPVLAVKAGRVAEGAKAAASHTGALAGSDDVYDAALRRAGTLRVHDIDELFDAVETLARSRPLKGDRLAIVTNGGGLGVMATDALVLGGGRLAALSDDTLRRLDEVLPATWSRGNPLDVIGDAPGERYVQTLDVLLTDPEVDAVLLIHAPTAIVESQTIAAAVAEMMQATNRNVLASWVGGDAVRQAKQIFSDRGIPVYETPDKAVRAFLHLVHYRRNQELLMETPHSGMVDFTPATAEARAIVLEALASGRDMLTEPESKAILRAYGIPVVETRSAKTPEEACRLAVEMGFPVAVKILSPDITHKSDVGGVALDLESAEDVEKAASAMASRLAQLHPDARLAGFTVQRMARRPGAHELIVGATVDGVFGPVILFGHGGTAVEVIRDRAVGLPPLNMNLARELISHTRVSRMLAGYRDRPAADLEAICLTLLQVSQLVSDIAEIVEVDINPLFADDEGVLALDARLRVRRTDISATQRLAIRPYPKELEEWVTLNGQRLMLRPIRPEDEPQHREFLRALDPEDIRFRFLELDGELPHSEIARFTQIDYDREMAFIASAVQDQGGAETLGVVRALTDPDNQRAEFSVIVHSALKGKGLGRALVQKMIAYCRDRGTRELAGRVMLENRRMLSLAVSLGFEIRHLPGGKLAEVRLGLQEP